MYKIHIYIYIIANIQYKIYNNIYSILYHTWVIDQQGQLQGITFQYHNITYTLLNPITVDQSCLLVKFRLCLIKVPLTAKPNCISLKKCYGSLLIINNCTPYC